MDAIFFAIFGAVAGWFAMQAFYPGFFQGLLGIVIGAVVFRSVYNWAKNNLNVKAEDPSFNDIHPEGTLSTDGGCRRHHHINSRPGNPGN